MAVLKTDVGTSNMVKINVGGTTFITTSDTLQKVPGTRLASLSKDSQEYMAEDGFYFFDRNPELFNFILDFCRSGELHLPQYVCWEVVRKELEFWQIPERKIAYCCSSMLLKFKEELAITEDLNTEFIKSGEFI